MPFRRVLPLAPLPAPARAEPPAAAPESATPERSRAEPASRRARAALRRRVVSLHERQRPARPGRHGRRDRHTVLVPLQKPLAVAQRPLRLVVRALTQLEPELVQALVHRAEGVVAGVARRVQSHLAGGRHQDHVLAVDVHGHEAVLALVHALALGDSRRGEEGRVSRRTRGYPRRGIDRSRSVGSDGTRTIGANDGVSHARTMGSRLLTFLGAPPEGPRPRPPRPPPVGPLGPLVRFTMTARTFRRSPPGPRPPRDFFTPPDSRMYSSKLVAFVASGAPPPPAPSCIASCVAASTGYCGSTSIARDESGRRRRARRILANYRRPRRCFLRFFVAA